VKRIPFGAEKAGRLSAHGTGGEGDKRYAQVRNQEKKEPRGRRVFKKAPLDVPVAVVDREIAAAVF
jgi:hypothetical protein